MRPLLDGVDEDDEEAERTEEEKKKFEEAIMKFEEKEEGNAGNRLQNSLRGLFKCFRQI